MIQSCNLGLCSCSCLSTQDMLPVAQCNSIFTNKRKIDIVLIEGICNTLTSVKPREQIMIVPHHITAKLIPLI